MPWRSLVAITDSGTPGLSATSNFTVTVNPTTHPGVGSVTILGGQVSLVATGAVGPDYTVTGLDQPCKLAGLVYEQFTRDNTGHAGGHQFQ
jgi:hypothetical protein